MEDQLVIESATPRGTFGDSQYLVKTNQGDFYYVPVDYVNRGYATDKYQYYNPEFLNEEFLKSGQRVTLDPSILEGKPITSSFENPNSGYLFKADEFTAKIPDWAYYHELGEGEKNRRISGISQVPTASGSQFVAEEGLKYLLEGGGDKKFSFIRPDATVTTRTLSIEYSGIFGSRVAEALAKGAQAIGKVPFLTELTYAIPVVGPAVYGTIKGAQAGAAGKDPLQAVGEIALNVAATQVLPAVVKDIVPPSVSAIPGAVPAISGTAAGLLSGQDLGQALQTGLASGAGSVVGGQVAGSTGSQAAGQVAGGATAGLLAGKDAASAVLGSLIGTTASQAGKAVNQLLTQPQATQGSNIGGPMEDFSNGAVEIFDDGSRIFFDNSGNAVGSLGTDGNIYNATGYNLQLFDDGTFLAQNLNTGNYSYSTTDAPLFTGNVQTGTIGSGLSNLLGGAASSAGGALARTGGQAAQQATRSLLQRLLGAAAGTGAGATGSQIASRLFGGAAEAGINLAAQEAIIKRLQEQGANFAQKAVEFGAGAQVPFTPYTVTTGLGTSTFGPTGATATAAAPYQNIQQTALQQAQEALGAINPAQASQTLFGQLEGLQAPFRQREQEALLSRLGARGLLGFGQNVPVVGGAIGAVNPYIESLLSAQATQQAQNALAAQQFGTQEAARQQQLAQALTTQGAGIDRATADLLAQASTLGQIPTNLALTNAQRLLGAQLAGLQYQTGLEEAALGQRNLQTRQLASTVTPVAQRFINELFS
jgi:hypothetical protein